MLGPLRRTAIRLWILMGVLAVIFTDVTIEEFFVSAALSTLFVVFGLITAVVTFLSWKQPVTAFKYFGKPVAGGVAELRDPKFEGAWANVVIPVPYKLDFREDINVDRLIPADLKSQWDYFCQQPEYAEAFRTIVAYLGSHPQTPAATVRGGHRGATLLEHSFNVWRTMRSSIDDFEYTGMKDRAGKVYFNLIKGENGQPFRFEHDDPLPYLAAVTHDIGKITCYQPAGEGRWTEVLPEHDSEGAKILRRLRIYEKMPRDEAQRLIVTVGHYHKMDSVPIVKWIDDRNRALLNILYDVDYKTGELEGEGAYDAFISNVVVSRTTPLSATPAPAQGVEGDDTSSGHEQTAADSETLRALTGQGDVSADDSGTNQASDETSWAEAPGSTASAPDEIDPLDMPFPATEEKPVGKKSKGDDLDFEGAQRDFSAKIDMASVIDASKALETLLEKHWGATGKGLHEKVTSVEGKLAASVVKSIRFVATVRNQTLHEADYKLSSETAAAVVSASASAQAALKSPAKNNAGTTSVTETAAKPTSKPVSNPLDNSITDDEIIAMVGEVLLLGKAVNGKKNERIAYKHRSWLFIYERDLCQSIDKNVPGPQKEHHGIRQEHLYPADSGKHADFTRRLMVALSNKGALRQEWDGNYYGARSAYFWAAPARKPGTESSDSEAQMRTQHVIVCRAFAFGVGIFRIPSCQLEPVIQGCIYQPLTDPGSIDRAKQLMSGWTEPQLLEDKVEEKKRGEEAKRSERVNANVHITKAAFEPSLIGSAPAEAQTKIFRNDPTHGFLFAIDEVLKHFDEPMLPARVVELDGISYYSFSKKGK